MELTQVKPDDQTTVDVPLTFNKDGDPVDGFKVVGPNSHQYQEADRKWRRRSVKRAAVRGRPVDGRSDEGSEEIVNATQEVQKAIVYACIVEAYGFTVNGEPAPLNAETLDAIFAARPAWLLKVYMAIEAEAGFTKG